MHSSFTSQLKAHGTGELQVLKLLQIGFVGTTCLHMMILLLVLSLCSLGYLQHRKYELFNKL